MEAGERDSPSRLSSHMLDLPTLRVLLDYTDWSTKRLLECAAPVVDSNLDRDLQIGPGTLRQILLHTYNGEFIWFRRWQRIVENPWPSESEPVTIAALAERFAANTAARNIWLASLPPESTAQTQTYRDS